MMNIHKKSIIICILITILCGACKNHSIDYSLFEISSEQVQSGLNSVTISGTYSFPGEVNGMKINMGLEDNLSDATSYSMNLEGRDFSVSIDSLNPNTTYYYCYSIDFGLQKDYLLDPSSFITLQGKPEVETVEVIRVDSTSYYVKGVVVSDNGSPITERGICWNTLGNPNPLTDSVTRYGENGVGEYQCLLSHLALNTKYHVCAYAKNEKGMGIGQTLVFQTEVSPEPPTVITADVYDITATTATGGGEVVDDGQSPVTSCGVCWSTEPNPTIVNDSTVDGSGLGPFVSSLTNLIPNTTYYVRAYATNIKGTEYGNEVSFTTLVSLPTVITTDPVTNITSTSATGGGDVTNSGGADVTERGICWGTSHNPTISDSHDNNGTGTGSYTVNMTDLTANTKYYVRAYAFNSAVGPAYGNEVSFTTSDIPNYTITVSANPSEGGSVTGGGTYQQGQTCTLEATANNGYTFTNWTENGDVVYANTNYTFTVNGNRILVANFEAHEYVDLGLPSGTLWATCNIGATTPEGYGDYFAWGETSTKDGYDWHTYRYCNGGATTLTKYCDDASYGYNGFIDNLTVLEESDDAAAVNWGAGWRMPTKEEWNELLSNTTKIWTTQHGVNGYLFTATNGRTLFLPAAGYYNMNDLNGDGKSGCYWSSSLNIDVPYNSGYLFFDSGNCSMSYHFRSHGRSVRPVRSALKK